MSCETIQSKLIDYHYLELPREQLREIAEHLPECGACARSYCRIAVVSSQLDEELLESPSRRVEQAIAAQLERTFGPPWWRRALDGMRRPLPFYQWAMVTTLLLLLFAFLSGVWSAPGTGGATEPALRDYDASHIVRVDPHTL